MKKEYDLLTMRTLISEDEECRFEFEIKKRIFETMPHFLKKQVAAHMLIALSDFFEIDEKELMEFYLNTREYVESGVKDITIHPNAKNYH